MSKVAAVNSNGKTVLVANNTMALALIAISFAGIQEVASLLTGFNVPEPESYNHMNAGLQRMYFVNRITAWANTDERVAELVRLSGKQAELEAAFRDAAAENAATEKAKIAAAIEAEKAEKKVAKLAAKEAVKQAKEEAKVAASHVSKAAVGVEDANLVD
jgi:hypothetical protein